MKVLITGGAGFIGSHLAEYFVNLNYEITIVDNCLTGDVKNLKTFQNKITFVHGDIRNTKLIEELVDKSDLILHMAAALGVNNILEDTLNSMSINILGSEIVLLAATKFKKRIIIASTSEIYGKNPNQPLSEGDDRVVGAPQKIRWTYSDAKAIEESMAYCLFGQQGLQVTTLRFFNTVGPRQTGRYGMVIPRFVKSALENSPIRIFGNGLQSRVFCHVIDVVRAVESVIQNDSTIGEVFNVGGKGEITINELGEMVLNHTKSKSTIEHIPYEQAYAAGFEDIERRVPDISKIKSFVGWEPQISLSEIITDVVNHQKND